MYLRAGNLFCLTRPAHTVLNPTGDTLESPSRIPPAQIWGVLRAWFQTLPQQLLTDNIGLVPLLHASQAAVPMVHQLLLLHVNSLDLQTSLGNREMADRMNLHCVEKTNSCYNTFFSFFLFIMCWAGSAPTLWLVHCLSSPQSTGLQEKTAEKGRRKWFTGTS